MERAIKIAFVFNGVYRRGETWNDGLYLALQHLEKEFWIQYYEPFELEAIRNWKPDCILFWGALTEECAPSVASLPFPKAICFAGGAIESGNIEGWDLFFTESGINEKELEKFGKKYRRAFGINEVIFSPSFTPKKYTAFIAGTFALWKRHHLFAEAVGSMGVAIGITQKHERECYEVCFKWGVRVLGEQPRSVIASYIQKSYCVLNTASYWGGGQRLTLEAMACNVPPIVMSDSPKNCEYVLESGYGIISEPDVLSIREAIKKARDIKVHMGRQYIESKWTSNHYAENLKKGILEIL